MLSSKRPLFELAKEKPWLLLSLAMYGSAKRFDSLRRSIAEARSWDPPIVLLQLLMRRATVPLLQNHDLRILLPVDEILSDMARVVSSLPTGDVDDLLYVLEGQTDDECCGRFRERKAPGPSLLLPFLLRRHARITQGDILDFLIESCGPYFASAVESQPKVSEEESLELSRNKFMDMMYLVVRHCFDAEPRLVVKAASLAARFIERIAANGDSSTTTYRFQCEVFNGVLWMLRPPPTVHPLARRSPNAYFWEAHRSLLAMSARLKKPLHVGLKGFRAIRAVLAGQAKNEKEMRTARRHAATWPPYILAADGMDERADAEDSLSRVVKAGIMMQEAGYEKENQDLALDIMQGMAQDGTPTIQQTRNSGHRSYGIWEATIRATRNAEEAWAKFQTPPRPGWKHGLDQYSVMFEKLTMPVHDGTTDALPGDKALNFDTNGDANRTEFEKARRRPPSVKQLYEQMRLDGIRPEGRCLQILVANAESLDTAHRYLRDSAEERAIVDALTAAHPRVELLKRVPMSLFEAYIRVSSLVDGAALKRAIEMTKLRMGDDCLKWAPAVWGRILQALSQHRRAIDFSRSEQISWILHVMNLIDKGTGVTLPTFVQFGRCIRKAVSRELRDLLPDLNTADTARSNPMGQLYFRSSSRLGSDNVDKRGSFYSLLKTSAERMKGLLAKMVAKERRIQELTKVHEVTPLDRMGCRQDPVSNDLAYQHMASLAFLGEFDEMARVLRWLLQEWGQADVVEAMRKLDETPAQADLLPTLCVFRLLAEPMLDDAVVRPLQQEVEGAAAAGWTWPSDAVVTTFAALQPDGSMLRLRQVLDRVQEWQKAEAEGRMDEENKASW